ncbi:MAG TPA: pyridoxine 5'-phosphate synthase [Planctomycetaceae bacterium]
MARLSVNVNKVATLRNSRGGRVPSVLEAVRVCIAAGAPGITVHPRADRRHITPDDVREIAAELAQLRDRVEFNIEGDPRPELLALVGEVRPQQCTLVPVKPGEITSAAGWSPDTSADQMQRIVGDLQAAGVRVSLFVDAEPSAIEWAARMGADRIELYTEPFARAYGMGGWKLEQSFEKFAHAARQAHDLGQGINAGHDLDLENLLLFRTLPFLDEVSIGHALISRALFVGLKTVVEEYLEVLSGR